MTIETKKHYPLSPSAAHRWLICPGEPRQRAAAPNVASSFMLEGTTAHWVAEESLRWDSPARRLLGKVCPETGMTVTESMCDAVQVYVDHCNAIKGDWARVEEKFTLAHISPDLGGTSDYLTVQNKGTLHVRDYKHGQGYSVPVKDNPQLLIYALGALNRYQDQRPQQAPLVKSITYGIVQPRLEDGEPIKFDKMLTTELIAWQESVLKPAIQRIEDEHDTLIPGNHCHFCPAKATCPAQYRKHLAMAEVDFAVVKPGAKLTLPSPESMPIEKLVVILEAADDFTTWLASIEAHAQRVLESGKEVPGYKLVKKKSNRAWSNESTAAATLVKLLGQTGAYSEPKLISVKQAEDKLKILEMVLPPELITKPDTGLTIVPLSDKRPSVKANNAALDFLPSADIMQ